MYKINDNKFYIAIVLDLFSKMVIGYAISSRNDEFLVINALKMAYEFRNCPSGVTFHSDQGSNYKSINFINLLHVLKINQSFSKKGTPFDNSPIESFFSNLKQGDLNNRDFEYLEDLKNAVIEYVNYYNYQRPHKALGFKTPFDFENEYQKKLAKKSLAFNILTSMDFNFFTVQIEDYSHMAEKEGFEPPRDFHPLSVFKTDPFNRAWVFLHISYDGYYTS